ncbi:MAG TPA: hypothetical protein VME22_23635 [Solirubrobacteraceae bacterium]|nr:hypothetical protein [Solirubrobacteraceae bacterium]
MQLSSVRDLKRELYEPLAPLQGLQAQQVPAVSVPAERMVDVARIQPGIALGVGAGSRLGDYRLAVRIQHRDLIGSSKLAAIEKSAHGEVDVQYIGELTKLEASSGESARVRPARPGTSIGHYAITAGTLGAFVRVDGSDQPRILSNNHVLADENRGSTGDEILQPGVFDGGKAGADRIGTLERFVALDPSSVNDVDAALAILDEQIEFDPTLEAISTSRQLADIEKVQQVIKRGRTTQLTRGAVTAIEVDNVVVRFSTGQMRFDGQIEIASPDAGGFSRGGDSGSLIVDEPSGDAVGLVFAGSDQGGAHGSGVSYGNPLAVVFDRLRIGGLW